MNFWQSLKIRREVNDKTGIGQTLNNIGLIHRLQGDLAKALEYHEQDLSICRELGDRAGEAVPRWNLGLTYQDAGDLAKAEEYMEQAVQLAKIISHPELERWRERLERVRARRRAAQGKGGEV
ncbi:MAG: tetratricopeptide repeat protein [Candidatus Electronema sp. VV]